MDPLFANSCLLIRVNAKQVVFDEDTFLILQKNVADILTFQKVDSGVENWHGLMEAQQGPVNNLNNPIEPAVQQVIIIMVIIALIIIFIIIIFIMNILNKV